MATSLSDELKEFHRFVAEKLAKGEGNLSPEAAVDQWRELHPGLESFDDDVTAVREALTDMAAGDTGMPLEQFDREFRADHDLSKRP
jgi:hypothetical protein